MKKNKKIIDEEPTYKSAGHAPGQEQTLAVVVEVKSLEGLLEVERGGGEDDDAEHGVVVEAVPGTVPSVRDPPVQGVGDLADDAD